MNNRDDKGGGGKGRFTTRVGLGLSISLAGAQSSTRAGHYHRSPLTPKFNQTLTSGDLIYRRLPLVFPIHRKPSPVQPLSLSPSYPGGKPRGIIIRSSCVPSPLPLPLPAFHVRFASAGNVITTTRGGGLVIYRRSICANGGGFRVERGGARILTPGHD